MGINIKNNYGPNIDVHDGGVVNLHQRTDGTWCTDNDHDVEDAEVVEEIKEESKAESKAGRPKKAGKKTLKSFIYQAHDEDETNLRLRSLYLGLLQMKWIADDTKLKNFLSIFSGVETSCRVVWTGEVNTLAELFRELVVRKQYVSLPEGESIWVMVNARFWEKEGNREFGNDRLRSTSMPTSSKETIEWLVRIMNPDLSLDVLKEMMQGQR